MLTGGCLCGAIRYEVGGVPFNATLCHCADCRSVAGAPAVAWFSARPLDLRFVAGSPNTFDSSAGVRRGFCPACGTPLTYQSAADEIDITTCSLDHPEAVPPVDQTWTRQRLPWIPVGDGLPCFGASRSAGPEPRR
jgi:hypothetical protein